MFFPVIGGPGFRLQSSARNQHKGLLFVQIGSSQRKESSENQIYLTGIGHEQRCWEVDGDIDFCRHGKASRGA